MKEKVTTTVKRTKRVISNGETFIQACALSVLVGFSFYASRKLHLPTYFQWVLAVSEAIVALRALTEYVRFLDKE